MASADSPGSSSGLGLSKNFDESSAGLLAPEHLIAAVEQRSAGGAVGTDGACEVATEAETVSRRVRVLEPDKALATKDEPESIR